MLFVHGFFCNRGLWNPWMRRLRAAGIPFVAVNLEPVFGSIDSYASIVEAAVRSLEQATGGAPVIVAHSMGGLAVRSWLQDEREASASTDSSRWPLLMPERASPPAASAPTWRQMRPRR